MSGIWYQPAETGQGFGIEIYPNLIEDGVSLVQLTWFRFDGGATGGAEKQRWYTASGAMGRIGARAPLTIYSNTGGNFDAAPATRSEPVGSASLAFTSCGDAELT